MNFTLALLQENDVLQFKKDIQYAFQQGAIDGFGTIDKEILSERNINDSLSTEGSAAYKALLDGEMVGGAVVIIDTETQHNHLDLLYVKNGTQGKGIGHRKTKSVFRPSQANKVKNARCQHSVRNHMKCHSLRWILKSTLVALSTFT